MEGEKSGGCELERAKKKPEMQIIIDNQWSFVPARQKFEPVYDHIQKQN